jgi:heptosyltransferase I
MAKAMQGDEDRSGVASSRRIPDEFMKVAKKILIIKTSALGDIVHVFPSVRFIKETFPECQIDWVVEKRNAPLIHSNPYVDRTIEIDTKKWRKILAWQDIRTFIQELRKESYDFVFDFQGNLKSGIVTGLSRGKLKVGFDWNSVFERPNWFFTHRHVASRHDRNVRLDYLALVEAGLGIQSKTIPEGTLLNLESEDLEKLQQFREKKEPLKHILVCPGSQWPNKRVLKEDLQQFLHKISTHVKFWFLYGSEQEKKDAEILKGEVENSEVLGDLSFALLQHVMREMDLVIAMDSFPLHLAAEAGVPTFSIFGASSSYKFKPLGSMHHAFQGQCPYGQTFVRRCPKLRTCKTGACIHHLKEQELFLAFSVE